MYKYNRRALLLLVKARRFVLVLVKSRFWAKICINFEFVGSEVLNFIKKKTRLVLRINLMLDPRPKSIFTTTKCGCSSLVPVH